MKVLSKRSQKMLAHQYEEAGPKRFVVFVRDNVRRKLVSFLMDYDARAARASAKTSTLAGFRSLRVGEQERRSGCGAVEMKGLFTPRQGLPLLDVLIDSFAALELTPALSANCGAASARRIIVTAGNRPLKRPGNKTWSSC